jgi:hypothetical protein
MSFDVFSDINWLAVVVATIAYFALGAIWYAPQVFGKAWARAGGQDMPEGQRPSAAFIVMPLAANLIAVVATALLIEATNSTTFGQGVAVGLTVSVGYAWSLTALGAVFDRKPEPGLWWVINALYHVLGLLIVGVILALWD